MPFGRELYIERSDFMEDAPKNFFRLTPNGREVRLKSAYIVQCTGFKKDADGNVTEVYCTYDPTTKSGTEGGNKKVKSTINWVNIHSCIDAEVRLYDRLFSVEDPLASEKDFHELINPESLKILQGCKVEASLKDAKPLSNFQFLKIGYFTVDEESTKDHLIFNRTVSLKDTWAKKTE
jgi:glutaminyl-tRNA synthetase